MQLVLHTGAHFTEEKRLMKCLLRNKGGVQDRRVSIPEPKDYRKPIRDTLFASTTTDASLQAREGLMDMIIRNEGCDRLILSNANFIGDSKASVQRDVLYPEAAARLASLSEIFQGDQLEIFMALRNPATFLPAVFQRSPLDGLIDYLGGTDPGALRWSETLVRIREAVPDIKVTVWCNEDAPFVWPQIIREILGLPEGAQCDGGFDLLEEIMHPEGMGRFLAYLEDYPDLSEPKVRQVMMAFLDKYAIQEAVEEEVDMSGWTEESVEQITQAYEEDVSAIARLSGVELIAP